MREVHRVVHSDACIEVDTNFYSVPWKFIKEQVVAQVSDTEVVIFYGLDEIARHRRAKGTKERCYHPHHMKGIIGYQTARESADFLRPLAEYESVAGGGWT